MNENEIGERGACAGHGFLSVLSTALVLGLTGCRVDQDPAPVRADPGELVLAQTQVPADGTFIDPATGSTYTSATCDIVCLDPKGTGLFPACNTPCVSYDGSNTTCGAFDPAFRSQLCGQPAGGGICRTYCANLTSYEGAKNNYPLCSATCVDLDWNTNSWQTKTCGDTHPNVCLSPCSELCGDTNGVSFAPGQPPPNVAACTKACVTTEPYTPPPVAENPCASLGTCDGLSDLKLCSEDKSVICSCHGQQGFPTVDTTCAGLCSEDGGAPTCKSDCRLTGCAAGKWCDSGTCKDPTGTKTVFHTCGTAPGAASTRKDCACHAQTPQACHGKQCGTQKRWTGNACVEYPCGTGCQLGSHCNAAGACVPTLAADSCHTPIAEFSLISQNTFLIDNFLKNTAREMRSRWLGEELGNQDFDIVVLQEVFATEYADGLRAGYGSRVNMRYNVHNSGDDSGLMIMSKFKQAQDSTWWSWRGGYNDSGSDDNDHCANMDCWAHKGARWARLKVPATEGDPDCVDNGKPCIYVNVMTVHLQSSYANVFPEYGDGLGAAIYQEVRRRNLGSIKRFYQEHIKQYKEPLIICGDWNMPLHAPWRQSKSDGSLQEFWDLDYEQATRAQVDSFETEWYSLGASPYSGAGRLSATDFWKYYHRYADPGTSEVQDALTYANPSNGGSMWVPADASENYRYDGCFVAQDSEKWQLAASPGDVRTEKMPVNLKVCKHAGGCCDVPNCTPGPNYCCRPPYLSGVSSLSDHFGVGLKLKVYRKPTYADSVARATHSPVKHTEPFRCGDGRCTQGERAVGDPNPQRAGWTECAADCGKVGNAAGTSWPLPYCGNGIRERVVQYNFTPEYNYRVDEYAETCARDYSAPEPTQAACADTCGCPSSHPQHLKNDGGALICCAAQPPIRPDQPYVEGGNCIRYTCDGHCTPIKPDGPRPPIVISVQNTLLNAKLDLCVVNGTLGPVGLTNSGGVFAGQITSETPVFLPPGTPSPWFA